MFHIAVVLYVTIHVSSVDVIRVAGPSTLRCSVASNVNLTTHVREVPGLKIRGFLPFTIEFSSKIARWNSLFGGKFKFGVWSERAGRVKNDSAEILSCQACKYEGYCTQGCDALYIVKNVFRNVGTVHTDGMASHIIKE
jgi:hypothetical protein